MFYRIVKIIARQGIKLYCRDVKINNEALLKSKGPLLLAVNHPNSFLDAIILCTLFDEPVHSLARGDAFNGKLISYLLQSFKMLPVYRVSEGVENLEDNYTTFSACVEIFKRQGTVLIFTEGRCENEWHLRPLKKGTARLAAAAWQQNIPLKILPIGINYNSFLLFGKNVHINMGNFIEAGVMADSLTEDGRLLNKITAAIQQQLQGLVYEIDKNDRSKKQTIFQITLSNIEKTILLLPSLVGFLFHAPVYFLIKKLLQKRVAPLGHFDSVIVGLTLVFYPLYILFWCLVMQYFLGGYWGVVTLFTLPLMAWCCMRLNQQID